MSKVVYENEYIVVREYERDYDFQATIENKSDYKIKVVYKGDYEDIEPCVLDKCGTEYDWRGVLYGDWLPSIDSPDISKSMAFEDNAIEIVNADNESEILYSCASDNEDTEKTQEEMQEELDGLESDIYCSLSDFDRVCGTVPELDDSLEMWNFINTMERVSEELRDSYTQYEDLEIKLRG